MTKEHLTMAEICAFLACVLTVFKFSVAPTFPWTLIIAPFWVGILIYGFLWLWFQLMSIGQRLS